ncbi:MAG: tetratricopeptide repeat protein [Gemmatimonadaceae bacterium]|nr:tetratricopeptide repeat protein [Gemmatimonadaceae bacterium]
MDPYDELDAAVIHERQGEVDDALAHYRTAESLAGADAWLLSEVLRRQAYLHHARSEWELSLDLARRAAASAEMAQLSDQHAEALIAIAWVHVARGAYEEAIPELERVASLTQDHRITGLALHNLGAIAAERGSWELSRTHFMESVKRFQAAGYQRGVAFAHNNYGRAALDHGNYVLAADLLQQAVSSAKKAADPDLLALATMNVAEALAGTGELVRAQLMAKEALEHFSRTGNGWRRVECERLLGDLEMKLDRRDEAYEWWRSALETARAIGAQLEVVKLEERLGSRGD